MFGQRAPIFEDTKCQNGQNPLDAKQKVVGDERVKHVVGGSNASFLYSSWLVGFKTGPKSKMTILTILCAEPICGLLVCKIGTLMSRATCVFMTWECDIRDLRPQIHLPRHCWFDSRNINF